MGLLASRELLEAGDVLAGPWHPAFGFLVRSEMFHRRIRVLLPEQPGAGVLRIVVHPRDVPLVRGYRNQGLREVEHKTGVGSLEIVQDQSRSPGEPLVEAVRVAGGRA
jgi:hypothetical protein